MPASSTRLVILLSLLAAVSACTDRARAPTELGISAARTGVPFGAGLASAAWQARAAALVAQGNFSPLAAGHAYPILGVAQYLAVQRAEGADGSGGRDQLELDRGAVAGASAVALTYLFPAQAQALEDLVTAQANAGPGGPHPAFTRGEAIGRAVGAEIVARAQGDGFGVALNPAPPIGPGFWTTNAPGVSVAGGQLPGVTRWFLTSASQFRPGPPPAFGSDAFNAALTEVRNLSNSRTPEQVRLAGAWAGNPGTITPPGIWLQVGTDDITARGLSEREATHLYALLSATMLDALIGCWDAKQTYWLIRPWQADVGVATLAAVGRPNHPSYPSGHSCLSASGAEVLSTFFPEDRDRLSAMVIEAGLSRMWAGIHYGFDISSGQELGRDVAHFAIAADASGNSLLTPR